MTVTDSRTTSAVVARASEMSPGSMKMARVGERRVVVIRSASGFHALDNACPHQGFGLATGGLDGELLTCQWHNWKFRVSDGQCLQGEENVACHPVTLDGDDIVVSVTEEAPEEQLARLWPSLHSAMDRFYGGQITRDTARLLQVGATADQIVADAITRGIPRAEWALGHELAVTADLLALSDDYEGIDKAIPLAHGLVGIAEEARDRPPHRRPKPRTVAITKQAFVDALEAEDWDTAAAALAGLGDPLDVPTAREWMIEAISQHHYSFGHGAIYTQKSFELIERIPELGPLLVEELALMLTMGTREDTLPYMRKAMREIDAVDTASLAAAPTNPQPDWLERRDALVDLLLEATEAPILKLVDGVSNGPGVAGLLDVVSLAASKRLLRYDLGIEYDETDSFGWLDITHALTYANAARWAWEHSPTSAAARLALMTAFMAFDSGRGDRRAGAELAPLPDPALAPSPAALAKALDRGQTDLAVAHALAGHPGDVASTLERASVRDGAGSFIVAAHLIKMAVAARHEAAATGSPLPLAATARFIAGPRRERFVNRNVVEAIDFVRTGAPPKR